MYSYIARQPIFTARMGLYGYELLHRSSLNNYYEGTDDTTSTVELMNNALFVFGLDTLIDKGKAFINFSTELLLTKTPLILPKGSVVIEILERVEPTEDIIKACSELKGRGYTLALDDFNDYSKKEMYSPLLQLVDIIKVEYNVMPLLDQRRLILDYGEDKTFLAEKVETRDDFEQAKQLGYSLFQGYFFSKPVTSLAKGIAALNINLLCILGELNSPEPNFSTISEFVEKDLGLSYRFLKLANSVYFGARMQVKSIFQAIVQLGLYELERSVHLMLVNRATTPENAELIKLSVIRGRVMSLLSIEMGRPEMESDCFLTGLFSSIDSILNEDMSIILKDLSFNRLVSAALLGEDGDLRKLLNFIISYESGDGERFAKEPLLATIGIERFIQLYFEAVNWQVSALV